MPESGDEREAVVDSDVDLRDPAQQAELGPREWDILLAIAVGGVIGALGRYGLGRGLTHSMTQLPWSTVIINVSGCLAIGALMSVLLTRSAPPRLARPFLGVGILGGYTTFSSFATDAVGLTVHHRPLLALGYLAVTILGGAVAVWAANATGLALIAPGARPTARWTGMTVLLISLGAFVGAPARYLTDRRLQRHFGSGWPWGTFTVNVTASLILGGLLGAGHHLDARIVALVGTGFCGALSTYSTFSFETLRLHQDGRPGRALGYAAASIGLALAVAALGWTIGSALS